MGDGEKQGEPKIWRYLGYAAILVTLLLAYPTVDQYLNPPHTYTEAQLQAIVEKAIEAKQKDGTLNKGANPKEAAKAIAEAAAEAPDSLKAIRDLIAKGELDKATQAIEANIQDNRPSIEEQASLFKLQGAMAFLSDTFKARDAYRRATELTPNDMEAWNQLGHLEDRLGNLDAALAAYQKVHDTGMARDDKDMVSIALGNMGTIAQAQGRLAEALKHYKKAHAINTELDNKQGAAISYRNMGTIAQAQGKLVEALKHYKKAYAISTALGNKQGMAASLRNMSLIAREQGRLEEAETLSTKSYSINFEINNKQAIATNLRNLGGIARIQGRYDEALKFYQHAFIINAERKDKNDINILNLSIIDAPPASLEKAEDLYRQANAIKISQRGMAINLGNMGNIAQAQGRLEEALKLHKQAHDINTELGNKQGMAANLTNMGNIAMTQSRLEEALKLHKQAHAINTELGNKQGMADNLANMGIITMTQGRLEEALSLYKKAHAINTELGNKQGMAINLGNMAVIFGLQGRYSEAKAKALEGLALYKEMGLQHEVEKFEKWITTLNSLIQKQAAE